MRLLAALVLAGCSTSNNTGNNTATSGAATPAATASGGGSGNTLSLPTFPAGAWIVKS